MALSRNDLKNLIRECMIEIMAEGLNRDPDKVVTEARRTVSVPSPRASSAAATKIGGTPLPSRDQMAKKRAAAQNQQKVVAESLSPDPVMQSIFADTLASSTFAQMDSNISGEQRPGLGGDTSSPGVPIDQIGILAESSSKWAALAFENKKPR